MSDKDPSLRRNAPKLELHVPEPPFRPGDTPDFSSLKIPAAGSAPRPDVAAPAAETHPLTIDLVRVRLPIDAKHRGKRAGFCSLKQILQIWRWVDGYWLVICEKFSPHNAEVIRFWLRVLP